MDKKAGLLSDAGHEAGDMALRALLDKKSGRRGLKEATDPTIRAALQDAGRELEDRLDRRLASADEIVDRTLEVYVEDLPELAAELAEKPGFEAQNRLLTESSEWYHAMSDVEYLEILHRQGRLGAGTAARYERLKGAIADQMPLIERLGFYVPEIPLGD